MKAILVILSFYLIGSAQAAEYYFSSTTGNDTRTDLEAQDPSTPWKTIDKLNSFSGNLNPGDAVFFKRDETFYGSIILKSSGTPGLPITIGAYGLGNRPVITSLVTLEDWVSTGNGIWESSTSLGTSVNIVLLNGIEQEMGRYPNSNAVNSGYLNFESHSGKTSITDNDLNTSINWEGAELVTRPRHWILNRSLITGQSERTISYTTTSPYEPYEKYGYFIQNSLKALDRPGEWYYNPSTKKLSVFFGSDDPSSYNIQATTMGNLISCASISNIVFDNLTVKGANGSGFYVTKGSNIFIQNCDILFSGVTGALVNAHTNFHVENSTISNSNNCGIDMEFSVKNAVIKNNKILNSALIAGLIQNGEGTGLGIYSNGEGADIENNEIINTGFIGITFYGSNVIIKNNVIDRFCFVKDDGGGIYSHGGSDFPTNRKITGNIIMNGIGAGPGTDNANKRSVSGIYMDANLINIEITGNTVTTCFQGIFIQCSNTMTVTNNTAFDNDRQMIIIQRAGNNFLVRDNIFTQNNLFSRDQDQRVLYIMSNADDIGSFGTFDYNYYARPVDDGLTIFNSRIVDGKTVNESMDMAGWQNKYGQDGHSKKSSVTIPAAGGATDQSIRFEYNATNVTRSIALNGKYIDVAGKKYSNNINLQPFTSIVLIKTGDANQRIPPTVNITSPENNSNFTALATLDITANADDVDGSVTRVDFYNGSTLIGSADASPFSFTWKNVPAGNYTLTAIAIDDDNLETTSAEALIAVTGVKSYPVVSLTAPEVSSTYTAPAIIIMSAAATDDDGSINKVQFYNGTTLLNTVSSPPYTFTWQNVPAGDYSITAKATDNDGLVTISDEVAVSVSRALNYPNVNMTAPAVNSIYDAPATITMSAVATDAGGSVSKVEFFNGNTLLHTQQSPPFDFTWQNVPAGDYLLTAKATDNEGLTTTSDVITVSVTAPLAPPVVNITSPEANSTFTAPATISLRASATDADGSVSEVEFFNGNTLLDSRQSPPYNFTWQSVPAGNYSLTAKATDNDGLTTSDVITISVKAPLASPVVNMISPDANSTYTAPATIAMSASATDADGSVSKVEFFNGNTLLSTRQSPPYNFTWQDVPAGNYPLTVKATDNDGLTTTADVVSVSVKRALIAPVVNLTAPSVNSTYTEAATINITAAATDADGSISKIEFFNGTTLLNTKQSPPYDFTWQNVPAGDYSLTAKATDNDGLSTTCAGVSVSVKRALLSPAVQLTAPVTLNYTAPATINITAAATDADGTISKVEFFNGTTLLNTKQSPPYNFTWQNVPAGNYSLTAKVTDNDGLTKTSAGVAVSVTSVVSGAPVVNLTSPVNNSTYKKAATITITATATDADGSISKVEFFNGTTLLSTLRSLPYTYAWKNVSTGNYSITAKATDNKGLTTTSKVISVSVTGTPPVVNVTSPNNNSTYNEPATITMSATATDADGSISKVEFFNGVTLLKSFQPSTSYTFSWKNVPAGTYTLTAKATDNNGLTTTSAARSVSVKAVVKNKPPTITITKPAVNASYTAPALIKITATATDPDGTISKVEFFNGSTLLKTETGSPYAFDWNKVPAGKYTLTAKATDNKGLATTSKPVAITVKAKPAARGSSSQDPSGAPANNEPVTVASVNNDYPGIVSGKVLSKPLTFRLLPNPAVNTIQIYFDELQTNYQKAGLAIYNGQGAVIKRYPVIIPGKKITVDISSLSAGIYIIELSNNDFTINKKFFKVN